MLTDESIEVIVGHIKLEIGVSEDFLRRYNRPPYHAGKIEGLISVLQLINNLSVVGKTEFEK